MHSLRTNTLRLSPAELQAILEPYGNVEEVPWYPSAFQFSFEGKIGAMLEYTRGFFYVQSLSSMLPVLALDPKSGDRVLDMAAAPGSKTTQIAMHMENQGVLIANDVSFQRLKPVAFHLDRLGILNCMVTCYDGARFPFSPQPFDCILLDAPCSGVGSTHEKTVFSPGRLRMMERVQKDMVVRAYDLLRPGGRLIYSTCTTRPEENEAVIDRLLVKRSGARIEKPNLPVPFEFEKGARVKLDESFFIAQIQKGDEPKPEES